MAVGTLEMTVFSLLMDLEKHQRGEQQGVITWKLSKRTGKGWAPIQQ